MVLIAASNRTMSPNLVATRDAEAQTKVFFARLLISR